MSNKHSKVPQFGSSPTVIMHRILYLLLLSSLTVAPVWSQDTSIITNDNLIGAGTLKYYFWDVYQAKLYAPNRSVTENSILALRLTYLRDLEGVKIAERSIEEMKNIGCVDEIRNAEWLSQMKVIFPDVSNGITLTGIRTKDGISKFYMNQDFLGEIIDSKFSKCFFDIWLGSKTSEPNLRAALLNLKGNPPND